MAQIDRDAFEQVAQDLDNGAELTLHHVGMVFGSNFYELIIMLLMDANDAARAIQGAVNRLRTADDDASVGFEDEDEDE